VADSTSQHVCATCGAETAADAQFCAHCGTRLVAADAPAAGDLPAGELGPVSHAYAERRVFGLAPPALVFALALCALVVATVLFVAGHWVAGLVLLILSAGFAALFLAAARQLPQGRLAHAAVEASDRARWRAGFARVSVSSWTWAGREVVRLRVLQRRLRREQRGLIYDLGEAVLAGEDGRAEALTSEARARGERIDECERQVRLTLASAHERVGRERAVVEPTRILADGRGDRAGAEPS